VKTLVLCCWLIPLTHAGRGDADRRHYTPVVRLVSETWAHKAWPRLPGNVRDTPVYHTRDIFKDPAHIQIERATCIRKTAHRNRRLRDVNISTRNNLRVPLHCYAAEGKRRTFPELIHGICKCFACSGFIWEPLHSATCPNYTTFTIPSVSCTRKLQLHGHLFAYADHPNKQLYFCLSRIESLYNRGMLRGTGSTVSSTFPALREQPGSQFRVVLETCIALHFGQRFTFLEARTYSSESSGQSKRRLLLMLFAGQRSQTAKEPPKIQSINQLNQHVNKNRWYEL
jgi:hypothetical protein